MWTRQPVGTAYICTVYYQMEREVEALKQTLGNKGARRPGLTGVMARTGETLAARWDRSMSVFNRQFAANQDDPIGYLVDEWSATLRLASNFSLARGYLLQSPSLVTHSPAIYSRIAQLEHGGVVEEAAVP